jgi:outer membrane protease
MENEKGRRYLPRHWRRRAYLPLLNGPMAAQRLTNCVYRWLQTIKMNERRELGSGQGAMNDRDWINSMSVAIKVSVVESTNC